MLNIKQKINKSIREQAIKKARTRIIIAGRTPESFTQEELEIIVKEEEDQIKQNYKEKGLLGLAALLGIGWWI
ncbi:hypothetical protein [Neptunicella marina]|uniref:Uncharacterized protein n=1 Tax=Neptunicella marina TaxID=2125989 RepID=A0A8J6M0Z5_9ALTE|nr:hypothetical protein [Neptunicella marina]MBC3767870.1 hypothetical protein [Neptunicella marina]